MVEIFYIFSLHIFSAHYFKLKYNSLVTFFSWAIYFILITIGNRISTSGVPNILIFLVLFLGILLLLYQGTIKQKALVAIFTCVFGIIAEILIYIPAFYIYKYVYKDLALSNTFYVTCIAASKFLWILSIRILFLISKRKRDTDISLLDWFEVFLIPVGSIGIIVNIVFKTGLELLNLFDVVVIGTIFVFNIVTYYLYSKVEKKAELELQYILLEKEREYYLEQYKQTEISQNKLREFKHDIKNYFMMINIFLQNKEYEKLNEYCENLTGNLENDYIVSNTGNIVIDSILNYKGAIAKNLSIDFELDLFIPQDLVLDSSDMAVILGNLLDNAIEAVKGLEEKDRKIQLKMRYDFPNISITVTNPFDGERKKDINQDYITTKKDNRNHGLGMKIVKKTVEKYQGIFETKDTNNVFITQVLLYDVLTFN